MCMAYRYCKTCGFCYEEIYDECPECGSHGRTQVDKKKKELEQYEIGENEEYKYYILDDFTCSIKSIKKYFPELVLPSDIAGRKVVSIMNEAISDSENIVESVIIPDSVKDIDNFTFEKLANLKHVRLSKSISRLRPCTIVRCNALEEIIIPSNIKAVSSMAIKDCKNLIGEHIKIIKEISKLKEDNDIKSEGLSSFNEKISEQYKKETKIYTDLQKELSDKKTILNNLEKKLVKVRAKALFKDSKNEIFIIEPTKENLEMNEEIIKLKESIEELEKKDKINSKKLIDLRNELKITQKVLSVKQYNYYNNINK